MIPEAKNRQIHNAILGKKSKAESITIPNFKIYYKPVVVKTVHHWHRK